MIDYHRGHVDRATSRIDEIIKQTQLETEDLKQRTHALSKQQNQFITTIHNFCNDQYILVTNNLKIRDGGLLNMKRKLDEISKIEKEITNRIASVLEQYLEEFSNQKVQKMIEETAGRK